MALPQFPLMTAKIRVSEWTAYKPTASMNEKSLRDFAADYFGSGTGIIRISKGDLANEYEQKCDHQCDHQWIDVGFSHSKWVCSVCDCAKES